MRRIGGWRSHPVLAPFLGGPTEIAGMVANHWRTIGTKPSYLPGYLDHPGSPDRAQRRADWIAELPWLATVRSAFEVGCGPGRNLCALRRRSPTLMVAGTDISAHGLAAARAALPGGHFWVSDLHCPTWAAWPWADVVLAVGVLCHLEPTHVPVVLAALVAAARKYVIVLDQPGDGRVLKGPRLWRPALRNTGEYVVWAHPLEAWLVALCRAQKIPVMGQCTLPNTLAAVGATQAFILQK